MVADGVNGTAGTSADHAANTTPQHPVHGMAARHQHGLDDGHVDTPSVDALELGAIHGLVPGPAAPRPVNASTASTSTVSACTATTRTVLAM